MKKLRVGNALNGELLELREVNREVIGDVGKAGQGVSSGDEIL